MGQRLPVEIWSLIFSLEHFQERQELAHLWNQARQVNHIFKAGIEYVFKRQILQDPEKCSLWFRQKIACIQSLRESEGNPDQLSQGSRRRLREHIPSFCMAFGRYADSTESRAVFVKSICCTEPGCIEMGHEQWFKNCQAYLQRGGNQIAKSWLPSAQGFVVKVGSFANDTDLPDLSIDRSAVEMTFDWRAAFDLFYAEAFEIHRRNPNFGLNPELVKKTFTSDDWATNVSSKYSKILNDPGIFIREATLRNRPDPKLDVITLVPVMKALQTRYNVRSERLLRNGIITHHPNQIKPKMSSSSSWRSWSYDDFYDLLRLLCNGEGIDKDELDLCELTEVHKGWLWRVSYIGDRKYINPFNLSLFGCVKEDENRLVSEITSRTRRSG